MKKKYETYEEMLFDIISSKGEILEDKIHILEIEDPCHDYFDGEKDYRVYHADGYCFTTYKRAGFEDDTKNFLCWDYEFYSNYEGFEKIDVRDAINLLK